MTAWEAKNGWLCDKTSSCGCPGVFARMRRPTVRESDAWKLLSVAYLGRLRVPLEGVW